MNKFNEKWSVVEKGIAEVKAMLAGDRPPLTAEEYMPLFTAVYDLCQSSKELLLIYTSQDLQRLRVYNKYRITFEEYLSSTVLPSLQEKRGELLLRDFITRWSNHKRMTYSMSRIFLYLDRYFTPNLDFPNLKEVALICFRRLVYKNIKGKIRDTALSMIDQEREGHKVDQALLKNVACVLVEIGNGGMKYYVRDFEAPMLKRTSTYYSQNASNWILQADECLKAEEDRASNYLHHRTGKKLLKRVQQEFLAAHTAQLQLHDSEEMQVVP